MPASSSKTFGTRRTGQAGSWSSWRGDRTESAPDEGRVAQRETATSSGWGLAGDVTGREKRSDRRTLHRESESQRRKAAGRLKNLEEATCRGFA